MQKGLQGFYLRDKIYTVELVFFVNIKKTSIEQIESTASNFRKPRVHFLSIAHSDARSPKQMGTLTGSVKEMAEPDDIENSFKRLFNLKHLGL